MGGGGSFNSLGVVNVTRIDIGVGLNLVVALDKMPRSFPTIGVRSISSKSVCGLRTANPPSSSSSSTPTAGLPWSASATYAPLESYRLVGPVRIDAERSEPGLIYLELTLSYAFENASGRYRTEDVHHFMLVEGAEGLVFGGRWQ